MKKFIVLSLAATTILGGAAFAHDHMDKEPLQAQPVTTVTETTIVEQQELPNYNKVNFMDFDLNEDGVLNRDEVGEKLFYIFDTDGNEVVDNVEMKDPRVLSFVPMEKETVQVVNFHDTPQADIVTVTYETFLKSSSLIRYDEDKDGLSPLDFLGKTFLEVDVKDDKVIDLEEWKRAYADVIKPLHEEDFIYND